MGTTNTTRRNRTAAPVKSENGTWEFWFDRGPGLRSDGEWAERRRVHRRGYRTKAEAVTALDKLRVNSREGAFVDPSKVTVAEYLNRWLDGLPGTNAAPATVFSYRKNLERHVLPRIGGQRLQSLRAADLKNLYADLQKPGANLRNSDVGLSPRTVRYIHSILHRALSEAVGEELLVVNPSARERLRSPSARMMRSDRMKYWTPDEIEVFLRRSEEEGDRDRALSRLVVMTGLRRGEALGLRWCDVDLEAGEVAVQQAVVVVNHEVIVGPTKNDGSTRRIEIDTATVEGLRRHRTECDDRRALADMRPIGRNDLVFAELDAACSALHPEAYSKRFDRRVSRFGLPHIGVHGLRHSHAVTLLKLGVHPKVVQERLGHANIAMTMDIYSAVIKGMGADAAQLMANLVANAGTGAKVVPNEG